MLKLRELWSSNWRQHPKKENTKHPCTPHLFAKHFELVGVGPGCGSRLKNGCQINNEHVKFQLKIRLMTFPHEVKKNLSTTLFFTCHVPKNTGPFAELLFLLLSFFCSFSFLRHLLFSRKFLLWLSTLKQHIVWELAVTQSSLESHYSGLLTFTEKHGFK